MDPNQWSPHGEPPLGPCGFRAGLNWLGEALIRRGTKGSKPASSSEVFRATGITAYLEAGGTLENAQAMAARAKARARPSFTTAPARDDEITLDEIERINI